jgi:hypothetical protein
MSARAESHGIVAPAQGSDNPRVNCVGSCGFPGVAVGTKRYASVVYLNDCATTQRVRRRSPPNVTLLVVIKLTGVADRAADAG